MRAAAMAGVSIPRARDVILQDHLLLQHLRFLRDHILLGGLHVGFGLHRVDLRDGAQFSAPLIILEKPGIELQRLLFDLQLIVVSHQIPVEVYHARHRGDHLILKSQIVGFEIVLRLVISALIERHPEAVEQWLRDAQRQAAAIVGIEDGGGGVLVIVENAAQPHRDLRAFPQVLLHTVYQALVGIHQRRSAGERGRRQDLCLVIEIPGDVKGRVHVGDGGARQLDAQSAQHAIIAAPAASAARPRIYRRGAGQHIQRGRRRPLRNVGGNVAQELSGAGALQIGERQLRRIARAFDIQIVLERERDGVAQRQINVPRAHQFVDTRRIREADAVDVACPVIVGQPVKEALAVVHLQRVGLAEHRDGRRKAQKNGKK